MSQNLDSTAEKTVLTIKDLQSRLDSRGKIKFIGLQDLENSEQLIAIQEAMEIVSGYREVGALERTEPQVVREDLTRLSALNINIGQLAGVTSSNAQNAEDAIKLDRAKTHLELKELKETLESDGQRVRATEKDIEAVSRVRAQDIIDIMQSARTTGEYSRFAYYSISNRE